MVTKTILIIGASGQLGSVLTKELQKIYGKKSYSFCKRGRKTIIDLGFKYKNDVKRI